MIASIHQPSTATFNLFDKLLLLFQGRTCYFSSVTSVQTYFNDAGHPIPFHTNPAEYLLDLVNVDFAQGQDDSSLRLDALQSDWEKSESAQALLAHVQEENIQDRFCHTDDPLRSGYRSFWNVIVTLIHRSFIKSYKDVVVYGIRAAMYIGMLPNPIRPLNSSESDLLPSRSRHPHGYIMASVSS